MTEDLGDEKLALTLFRDNGQEIGVISMGSPQSNRAYPGEHFWYQSQPVAPYRVEVRITRTKGVK